MKDAPTSRICKHCGKEYNPKEVKRIYGKYSMPYAFGFCSALCYTRYYIMNANQIEK
jgi:hypothetical protein